MRGVSSLRGQLILLFASSLIIPVIIMALIISFVGGSLLNQVTSQMTDTIIQEVSRNIQSYQEELDRLTIIPYLNDDILYALKLKSSGRYKEASDYNRLVADRALESTLPKYIQNTRDDILGFTILMDNGQVFQSIIEEYNYSYVDLQMLESSWLKKARDADGKAIFLGNRLPGGMAPYPEEIRLLSVARVINDPDTRKTIAAIVADADSRVLEEMLGNIDFSVHSKILITDKYGESVYSKGFALEEIPRDNLHQEGPGQAIFGNERFSSVSTLVEYSGWTVTVFLSISDSFKRLLWIYGLASGLILSGFLISLMIYRQLSFSIVRPIQEMVETMYKAERGDLTVSVHLIPEEGSEIRNLAQALNRMISSLKIHIDNEYVAVLNQKNAQYQALQSQIKPHFLNNTLNGFIGLNHIGEREKLDKCLRDLTGMLQYIQQSETETSLGKELKITEQYCRLQMMRYPKRLRYKFSCDDDLYNFIIPRLLIQPLVENAIVHGMESQAEPCFIRLKCIKGPKGAVEITIEDDGSGFDPELVKFDKGIGVGNCRERLMMFNQGAVFSIKSTPGKGTVVTLFIPGGELEGV